MSITEQITELRALAETYSDWGIGIKRTDRILRKAADTIESLSAAASEKEEESRYKLAETYHIGETVNRLHELCGEEIGWIHYGREISDSFQMINKLCDIIESLSVKQ